MIFVLILLMICYKIKFFKIFDKFKYVCIYVDVEGKIYCYSVLFLFVFIIMLFIGLLIGLFGIGGGVLMIFFMFIVFRFLLYVVVGISMMMIFFLSVMSLIGYIF